MVAQPSNEPDGIPGTGGDPDDFVLDVDKLGPDQSAPRPTGLGPMSSHPTSRLAKTDLFLDVDELKPEAITTRSSTPTPVPPPAMMPAYPPPTATPMPMGTPAYQPPAVHTPPSPVVVVAEPLTQAPPPAPASGRGWMFAFLLLALTVGGGVAAWRLEWFNFDSAAPSRPNRVAENSSTPKKQKEEPPAPPPQKNDSKEVVPFKNPAPVLPKVQDPDPPAPPVKVNPDPPPVKVEPVRPNAPRRFVSSQDALAAMVTHLRSRPANEQRYQRFFTLSHLYNNPRVPDAELDQCRTALTKLVQHLQPDWASGGLQAVDRARTVYSLDLRSLGWDRQPDGWRELLKRYPYGLDHSEGPSQEAEDAADLSKCDVPTVRADWFLAAVPRQPLLARVAPKAGGNVPEAIHAAAARYQRPVGAEEAALELGLRDPSALREKIRASDLLRNQGLAPLLDGGTIPRATWAAAFAAAVSELELGLPLASVAGGR